MENYHNPLVGEGESRRRRIRFSYDQKVKYMLELFISILNDRR